ncbi:MAG: heat-inducible transcription repressor HrcA [Coriobacteriales bacterium]|nr:heat-inducible transcription repressor HrcA [Coriobacteriales bacterium]
MAKMLSDRRRRILNALINEYISTAAPVSSKALVGNYDFNISSATVRNELYVLEEDGYVISPHVSSGRIPTDSGYRAFVDQLIDELHSDEPGSERPVNSGEAQAYADLANSAAELDAVLHETSRILNRFSDCLALVIAPRISKLTLRQISLISMDSHHVIAVLVVKDGRVLNKVVELKQALTQDELRTLERLLNDEFVLRGDPNSPTLIPSHGDQIQKRAFISDPACQEALITLIDQIDECLLEGERDRLHINGIEALFSKPEMQKMSLSLGFARLLDDDLRIFRLLDDFLAEDGVSARIGHENVDDEMSDVSVIAAKYGEDSHEGLVAVVGPTRMDYSKVIDSVERATDFLDKTMGVGEEEDEA